MPRAGWVKPQSDQRLSDHISIGVLTRVFPPELVERVVAEAGRTEQRQRLLPARVVVYYVLGLGLYSSSSYEEVMRMLVDGLSWQSGWRRPWSVPTKAALFKARARLGAEPLRALFEQVAAPLAEPQTAGAFYRDWRLVSIDGTCLDVADTLANERAFGRPGSGRGEGVGAFPQLRLVGLGECGTHALFGV
ncbi:MAG: transposase domain-containing protein, partial [Solirubrobacteraceae bacterium]